MIKMTKIKEIKVTNNYVLINLDDRRKFKISEDDYFLYKYHANDNLSQAQVQTLEHISNFHNAYMRALNRLKYKDRTEHEIRSTIYDEFNLIKSDVDKIINKLKRYDFINDKRYTKELIDQSRLKYHGYNKIKDSLIKVRINSTLIEKYLVYDEEIEVALASIFAEKTVRSIRNKNYRQTLNTLKSRLMYRGFSSSTINLVLDKIEIEKDLEKEKALLIKDYKQAKRRYQNKFQGFQLRDRLYKYLINRGYMYEMISELLEEMENYE